MVVQLAHRNHQLKQILAGKSAVPRDESNRSLELSSLLSSKTVDVYPRDNSDDVKNTAELEKMLRRVSR